ncbi:MAG: hypothetical protein QXT23_04290 [Acidilobaceae archaeon]
MYAIGVIARARINAGARSGVYNLIAESNAGADIENSPVKLPKSDGSNAPINMRDEYVVKILIKLG